ncbi:MAG TPA: NAD+ synthase [Vulgatibacter sp.]|nr:NAD+ synthase [Vulgatibacter sp.]
MRIAIGQIDTTVGAFEGNVDRIASLAEEAARDRASVLLLPEQTLGGYPARDFLLRPEFVERGVRALEDLAARTRHLPVAIAVGHALPHDGPGTGLYNAAVVLRGGRQVAVARKRLLPAYDVFDEPRWFDPGDAPCVFDLDGVRIGLTICEDLWSEPLPGQRRRHLVDPARDAAEAGARLLLNLSASPYEGGKERVREWLVSRAATRSAAPIVYCNLVGGNDSLVFDGSSFVAGADGRILARAGAFVEELLVVDVAPGGGRAAEPDESGPAAPSGAFGRQGADPGEVLEALTLGLRDYVRKSGFSRVVLGLSGGIDSAVTAAIAVRALGAQNVVGVAMPSRYTAGISNVDAEALAGNLAIRLLRLPIESSYVALQEVLSPALPAGPSTLTLENLQARSRGVVLMALSNELGAMVLTTGNKSELAVGYCTLYGDMAGGLAVLGDLLKTEVYALARHLNRERVVIPERTITRPPSAELREGQTDQDSLPPYDVLDRILRGLLVERHSVEELIERGEDEAVARRVAELVRRSEFKRRQAAPVIKVSPRAFGVGWRFPICHGFR